MLGGCMAEERDMYYIFQLKNVILMHDQKQMQLR
jgi:hypothetical protein